MARPEVSGCRPGAPDKIEPADRDAYSVEAFARAHSLSVAMFYKLRAQGLRAGAPHASRQPPQKSASAGSSGSRTNSPHGRRSEMDDDIPF